MLFALVVVVVGTMATANSQPLRRTGPLFIDDSKGYDGRSAEREWIPEETDDSRERER